MSVARSLVLLLVAPLTSTLCAQDWPPTKAPLMTKWAQDVSPAEGRVHPEYPRPQLVREHWQSLNGHWEYAIRAKDEALPTRWDGKILVPFPVESALSGVMKLVGPENRLWYRRTFQLPQQDGKTSAAWASQRILLHFGAVDWQTTVWVNGKEVTTHTGGYDPFSCDITDALQADGSNEVVVSVFDPSDAGYQPRGKQVRNPHGIWYTPTTGIWQTVWLEPVPKTYIRGITIVPKLDEDAIDFDLQVAGDKAPASAKYVFRSRWNRPGAKADLEQRRALEFGGTTIDLTPDIRAAWWSPDTPHLVDCTVDIEVEGKVIDSVQSYFAMRKIGIAKDEQGFWRLMLNNKPIFQYGPLDQGFWPDGLYTAPTDEALKYDLEMTKKLGFNMVRKHVKVEPARWYHHCDKLGLLVWQDLPSGDTATKWDPFGKFDNTEMTRSQESSDNLNREWKAIIDSLRHFPSIVMWVPFNEGWGQANTVAVTKWTKQYDPSRLVNCASGGNDFPIGDIYDIHRYPGPFLPRLWPDRATVLGEFGGLGLPVEGHTWQAKDNWGYRSFANREDLTRAYVGQLAALRPMIGKGLAAAIYTQTTDVEVEVNGLMTYDRSLVKMDADRITAAAKRLYLPPPTVNTLIPTSEKEPQAWRFTTEKPSDKWQQADFDDSTWKTGPGGFGEPTTPGSHVKTVWKNNDIWLRRQFELPADWKLQAGREYALRIHHDEDAEIFLDGQVIARTTGFTTDYIEVPLDAESVKRLHAGKNTLAVHCRQTGGGQYIDLGLVEVLDAK